MKQQNRKENEKVPGDLVKLCNVANYGCGQLDGGENYGELRAPKAVVQPEAGQQLIRTKTLCRQCFQSYARILAIAEIGRRNSFLYPPN